MPPKKKTEETFDFAAMAAEEDNRTAGAVFDTKLERGVAAKPAITTNGGFLPTARRKSSLFVDRTVKEIRRKMDAWSYSRYKDWVTCPYKCYLKHVMKIREPDQPAMARGTFIHKVAEDLAQGKITWDEAQVLAKQAGDKKLYGPKAKEITLLPFKKDFELAAKSKPVVEEQWGFSAEWEEVGWFGPRTWLRVKLDLNFATGKTVLSVIDHKSGRIYPDHAEQADLYALSSFIKYPHVKKIVVGFWYLDLGEKTFAKFDRSEMPALIKRWEDKTRPMMNDTIYPCRPGPYCRWCFHSKYFAGGSAKCEH